MTPAVGEFPYPHRTLAEVDTPDATTLCLKPDRISTVPILHGFGTTDCWQFIFVIPGERA